MQRTMFKGKLSLRSLDRLVPIYGKTHPSDKDLHPDFMPRKELEAHTTLTTPNQTNPHTP